MYTCGNLIAVDVSALQGIGSFVTFGTLPISALQCYHACIGVLRMGS